MKPVPSWGGVVFCKNALNNPVLRDRYKDKILPPCKKCMRGTHIGETYIGYEGKCIVPNTRKNPENEEENNKDDFNVSVLKQYFINSNKSIEDSKIADVALENILNNNNFKIFYTDWGINEDGIHKGDLFCELDTDKDNGKFKKMLEDYGFILKDTKDGLWITGVKE